jgi:KDO2-lipid IV(A) lauroyltransferase
MKHILVKIFRGLIVLLSKLPLSLLYRVGDFFSWVAGKVIHYRSDVVWINISRSFPDKKYKELKTIYKDFYRHLGELIAEFIWFGGSTFKKLRKQKIVKITNSQLLADIRDKAPSVTLLSTHCGNWELMGGLPGYDSHDGAPFAFSERDIYVVYKKLSSEVSDRVFALNRIAPLEIVGTECEVESKNILRFSIANKDRKCLYIYPADQAPYKGAGKHPIGEFMHQPTNAMIGSMGLACKLSHAVVYMGMKRLERGRYEVSFTPICEDASQMTPEEILRKYYDLLEQELNETPANWLWSHKRWK